MIKNFSQSGYSKSLKFRKTNHETSLIINLQITLSMIEFMQIIWPWGYIPIWEQAHNVTRTIVKIIRYELCKDFYSVNMWTLIKRYFFNARNIISRILKLF